MKNNHKNGQVSFSRLLQMCYWVLAVLSPEDSFGLFLLRTSYYPHVLRRRPSPGQAPMLTNFKSLHKNFEH